MLRKLQKSEKDVISTGTKLSHMRLRHILKENHYSAIPSIAFNNIGHHKALVGTVAKNQANIYDNQHLGTAFDLMCNFDNLKTEYTDGGLALVVVVIQLILSDLVDQGEAPVH